MRKSVLDASAILAALFREPGADVVEVHHEAGIVSSVNLSEVAARLSDRDVPGIEAQGLLAGLGPAVRPFDENLACMAGALRDATRPYGLSLGDRACFALGLAEGVPVVTVDPKWADDSAAVGVEVVLAR